MPTSYYRCSLSFILLAIVVSIQSQAQVKYVELEKRIVTYTASFARVADTKAFGAQIGYSKDGRIGVGVLYSRTSEPAVNTAGVFIEVAVAKPSKEYPLNMTMGGSFAQTWASVPYTSSYYDPNLGIMYVKSEKSISGQVLAFASEFSFHSFSSGFIRLEPFAAVAVSVTKISSSGFSEKKTIASGTFGLDLIFGYPENSSFIITPGIIFREGNKDFAVHATYAHRLD